MGVKLVASSNGSVELVPANTASNFTVTVPAATTTMVGTDATQTLTNKTSTTFGVGNATPSSSGSGITFPATQSASSDANTLDDYEEGTWTPTQGAGLTVVGSFSSAGKYVKIGKQVTVHWSVSGSTSVAAASANIICGGAPFTGDGSLYTGVITDTNNSNLGVVLQYLNGIYSTIAVTARPNIIGSLTYFV